MSPGNRDSGHSLSSLPSYDQLPVGADKPPGSAWGVFGNDDEVGAMNLLTADRVVGSARLVTDGDVFPLNWMLEAPSPGLFGRSVAKHVFIDGGNAGTEDYYEQFFPQHSTQWDGLNHIRHPMHGFYNGRSLEEIRPGPGNRNGIHNWARRGIVGRFVLADVARYMEKIGTPLIANTATAVSVDVLDAALADQRVKLDVGDVLLIRFGWISWYETAATNVREALAREPLPTSIGLEPGRRTVQWLWDHHVAAVAADNPGLDRVPFELTVGKFLHYDLLPLLGIAIGELFALDALADDCADDGRYEGFFTSAPLNKLGGIGSPANALAIK